MRNLTTLAAEAAAIATLVASVGISPAVVHAADAETIKQGKEIAFDRKLGNCLACHQVADGESPGDIGPPLFAMKSRFPDKDDLRAQLWDPTKTNPGSRMPPFGHYQILNAEQIDAIVEYIYTL